MNAISARQIREVLLYDAHRHYFGLFSAADVNAAYGTMRRSVDFDNPQVTSALHIGKVDGELVCNALWHEMSYNPVRFGTVSPFVFGGRNNIYRYCHKTVPYQQTPDTTHILNEIRHHLIVYMNINANPNGQWYDVIPTKAGWAQLRFIDGHSGPVYKMLAHLRDCIKLIARQNVLDFKQEPYRAEISRIVAERHPDGIRMRNPGYVACDFGFKSDTDFDLEDKIRQERMDDMADNLQITLDNRSYVPSDMYEQAIADRNRILDNIVSSHTK